MKISCLTKTKLVYFKCIFTSNWWQFQWACVGQSTNKEALIWKCYFNLGWSCWETCGALFVLVFLLFMPANTFFMKHPPIRVCTYLLPFPSILAGYPECLLSALYSFCVLIHTLRFPLMGLIFRTQSTYPSYMTLSVGDLHKKTSKPRRGLGLQTGLECVSRWAVNCTDVLMLLVAWEKKWMN